MGSLEHITDLAGFVTASPSSYHAAAEVARRLAAAGYVEQSETDLWDAAPGGHYLVRDGAIVAWSVPADVAGPVGFRIVGAHTDSPGFKLKPDPSSYAFGWSQAAMEVYGGPLASSWLDREFGLAGRVIDRDGTTHLVATPAWLRIPQVAPHLDRSVSNQLSLDRQVHLKPVAGLGSVDILSALAGSLDLHRDAIDGHDLFASVTQPPEVIGVAGEFLASARLDNLSSVHAGLAALLAAEQSGQISVLACFDHEEIGSASRSGAAGPLLESVLTRIGHALGWGLDEQQRALAGSLVISADAGHGIHPNYPQLHDPDHRPLLNSGPLLKVNANQRYTTEGPSSALWLRICRAAGVPTQPFVSNNAVPCGSTIGPITAARLGITSVDVGIPLLSMHSARELCGVADPGYLSAALTAFYSDAER
jgi:aspartyl aminopeptidase